MLDRFEGRCSLASSCGRKQGKGLAGISRQVSTGSGKVSADSWRCHGLAPWSLTPAATKAHPPPLFQMPRPCAVESHARRYKEPCPSLQDATALRRGVSRSGLQRTLRNSLQDATALRRGVSRSPLQRNLCNSLKMPRPCAVESHTRR